MKNFSKLVFLLPAIFSLFGCETTNHVQTPTGRPEVIVQTTDVDFLKSQLIDGMLTAGYSILNENKYSLTFGRTLEGMGSIFTQLAIGNSYSTTPEMVIRYNFAERGSSIRIIAFASVQTQMAFGQVRQEDISKNRNVANDIQQALEFVKIRAEGNSARMGFNYDDNSFLVNNLVSGGPAEKAGIKIGDKVILVDGKNVSGMNQIESIKSFWGKLGSISIIQIERNRETMSFEIQRAIID